MRVFRQECTPEDTIEFHAFAPLEASRRVTNGIPLGCSLFLPVHTVNCIQTLKAKVIGEAASEPPRDGQRISGLLFKRSFNYFIVSPEELAKHTNNELKTSVVRQKQAIVYGARFPAGIHTRGYH